MRETNHTSTQKLSIIFYCALTGFLIIFARLIQLQVIDHKKFARIGEKNFLRVKTVPSYRGNILDCNGNMLATNHPTTNIMWQGTGNHTLSPEQQTMSQQLAMILHDSSDQENQHSVSKIKRAEKFATSTTIAQNISPKQRALIAEQYGHSPNIKFTTQATRYYPYDQLACHVVGYLTDINTPSSGKMGLEKILEHNLQGEQGLVVQSINSFGKQLETKEIKQQQPGQDIHTTIDIKLQKIAQDAMSNHETGCFILLDPQTGNIPAVVSCPTFNPTDFLQKMSHEQWQEIQQKKPFLNRAFNAAYPPASIFKLVTIAAALEEGVIEQDSIFECKGYDLFKKRKYYCNRHSGHGPMNIKDSLAFSCNIPCYEIAKKIHIDTLANYAYAFGLGNKTNTLFTEQYGTIPTNEWKIMTKGERWWTGETLSASIGQSFLLTTPIQIACMIGAIFHGYLIKPRLLQTEAIEQRPIGIQEGTLSFLQDCMKSVITTGTGRRMSKLANIIIYAKTGTAQTITRTRRKRNDLGHKEHAWFVSYFYVPEKTDPLVLVILLEHVGGSRAAAQVAQKFLKAYLNCID